jgi:hypothetical protein
MLTPTQKQLCNALFHELKIHFPDIELVEIIENPFERDSVWMRIVPPAESARSIQFRLVTKFNSVMPAEKLYFVV